MSFLEPPHGPAFLFRSDSASSIISLDSQASLDDVAADGELPRRTRKRFTSTQLMMLEHLYHQTSHPTREQRETLAKEAAIELRSVTVWFQNKRQTERKVALSNHGGAAGPDDAAAAHTLFPTLPDARGRRISHPHPARSPTLSAASASSSSARTVRNHMHHAPAPPAHPRAPSAAKRPSLDAVATRAERPQPRTPPRPRTLSTPDGPRALYEHMPSSPPSPPSPAARDRDLLAFSRRRRAARPTLEWACAAARLAGPRAHDDDDADADVDMLPLDAAAGDTEDEMDGPHEALTPSSSLGSQASAWRRGRARPAVPFALDATPRPPAKNMLMDDEMEAALALCGLGGRR
ncbi:homeobox domain-containing protein [Phanerochaete sordida]|uniref:Homeobox domain-containing protein n=1 Tax=Phanerochaete sordida TaxID=48140 RepID=A0A9P3LL02_9APHY|nr:homeobox domain-containing protein [Phanerochaete sordida]